MLVEIEAALVKALEPIVRQGVRLKPFPDDLRELKQPVLSGQVLIAYRQSTFQQINNDPLVYNQLLQFDINTQVKGLRSHVGAYPLLDEIRFLLAGWYSGNPAQNRPAYLQSERFVDADEGLWSYSQSLIVPLTIEAGKRPELEPFFPPEQEATIREAWENLTQIQVTVGLFRSPVDRLSDPDSSTKDSEVTMEIPLDA